RSKADQGRRGGRIPCLQGTPRASCRLMSYASGRVVTADVSLIGADSVMLSNGARGVVLAILASTLGWSRGQTSWTNTCFAPFAIRLQFRPDEVYFVRS